MKIDVQTDRGTYDVLIRRGSLSEVGKHLFLKRKVLVITDRSVPLQYANAVCAASEVPLRLTVEAGEESKSLSNYGKISSVLLEHGFTRADCIVAVGGGTITDFGRYSADKLGVPFVSVPTLVSADGFSANICSIIIDGQKKSIPMIAATLVLCDISIVSHVPMFLTMSGVCDIMSKYISLADWKISNIVTGEYICPEIVRMAEEALKRTRDCCMDLLENKTEAYEAMAASLMESGLTMQMLSNSRAASGAEHLIAHLAEMRPPRFEAAGGIHGECVGVGTVLMAERYHEMIAKKPVAKPFVPYDEAWIREKFGPLADGIIK